MIFLSQNKRNNWAQYAIPIQDEQNISMFADLVGKTCYWVYCKDGKGHGRLPAIGLPGVLHIFGGESVFRDAGYRKHWLVFQNLKTGEFTFGNKPSFSGSYDPYERERAANMIVVNPAFLATL